MNANIIRPPKEEARQKDYFQDLENKGLINYSNRGSYRKWHWQYRRNPFCEGKDLSSWAYEVNGQKAGHLGVIPVELKADVRNIKAGWVVDFFTSPEYRKMGIGPFLVVEAGKSFDLLLSIGQTDMAFNLLRRMGWQSLGHLHHYIKIWDVKPLVEKKIKNKIIANTFSLGLNSLLKIYNFFNKPQKPQGIKIHIIDNFSEEAGSFWNEIAGYYKIIVPRNKAYLAWKYDLHPDMQHVKLRAERNSKVCGYIILRCIKSDLTKLEGLIVDIIVRPDDREAAEALIFAALEYFRNKYCCITRCFISQEGIQKVLNICGFLRRRSYMRFLISKKIDGVKEMNNLANWYLTAGDSDIDR